MGISRWLDDDFPLLCQVAILNEQLEEIKEYGKIHGEQRELSEARKSIEEQLTHYTE